MSGNYYTREDCDENGDPLDIQKKKAASISEWRKPKTQLERDALGAVGLSMWPGQVKGGDNARDLHTALIVIGKSMVPMTFTGGKSPAMPAEWIYNRIEACKALRKKGTMVPLSRLIASFRNEEKKQAWKDEWVTQHGVTITEKVYAGNVDTKEVKDVEVWAANSKD